MSCFPSKPGCQVGRFTHLSTVYGGDLPLAQRSRCRRAAFHRLLSGARAWSYSLVFGDEPATGIAGGRTIQMTLIRGSVARPFSRRLLYHRIRLEDIVLEDAGAEAFSPDDVIQGLFCHTIDGRR